MKRKLVDEHNLQHNNKRIREEDVQFNTKIDYIENRFNSLQANIDMMANNLSIVLKKLIERVEKLENNQIELYHMIVNNRATPKLLSNMKNIK